MSIACGSSPASLRTIPLTINAAEALTLTVEVADTDATRETGLMNRTALAEGAGMLFVFSGEAQRSFWMQNTYISLDLLFISAAKEILYIEAEATPLSTETIAPDVAAQYVLEVPGGYAAAHGVAVGQSVDFTL